MSGTPQHSMTMPSTLTPNSGPPIEHRYPAPLSLLALLQSSHSTSRRTPQHGSQALLCILIFILAARESRSLADIAHSKYRPSSRLIFLTSSTNRWKRSIGPHH